MTTDAVLTVDPRYGFYDIAIDDNGDIETADFFDTAILYSLFGERRATPDEVVDARYRRGWIGNLSNADGFENGSKLWLLSQARLTANNLNRLRDEAKKALQWLVDDGLAVSVDEAETQVIDGRVFLTVTIRRSRDKVIRRSYDLWENTGRAS